MKRDTTKSKLSAADRTTVSLHWEASTDSHGRVMPTAPRRHYLLARQELDGRLVGLTAEVRMELEDDEITVSDIRYRPSTPLPLAAVGVRVLRDLRLGDLDEIIARCLVHLGEEALPWLDSLHAGRARPGRAGTSALRYAVVARCREEAGDRAERGRAIEYMVQTWPDLFVSKSAANALVNRAKAKGLLAGARGHLRMTDAARNLLNPRES